MRCLIIFSIVLLASACSNSEKESKKSDNVIKQEAKKDLANINKEEALRLSREHNAINDWEDSASFTYKLQERLEDTVISFTGFLADITINRYDPFKRYGGQQDPLGIFKTYILKVTSVNSEAIAEILINELQLKELKNQFSKEEVQVGCFVFRVNRIVSMFPVLTSEGDVEIYGGNQEEGYDYDVNSNLTYEYEKVLIKFSGSLIDYYVYKNKATTKE